MVTASLINMDSLVQTLEVGCKWTDKVAGPDQHLSLQKLGHNQGFRFCKQYPITHIQKRGIHEFRLVFYVIATLTHPMSLPPSSLSKVKK